MLKAVETFASQYMYMPIYMEKDTATYQAQRAYFTGGHLRDIDLSAPLRSAISNAGIVPLRSSFALRLIV